MSLSVPWVAGDNSAVKRVSSASRAPRALTFNSVFGRETRSVVILYRKGWGESSWTRIEETAIRNRAHDEGYDFALFIPLDGNPTVPQWVPKNRLWIGLDRWKEQCEAAPAANVHELAPT